MTDSDLAKHGVPAGKERFELLTRLLNGEGSPEDWRRFRAAVGKSPDLWRHTGELSEQAAIRLIEAITPNQLARESMQAGWDAVHRELGYDQANGAERLLIKHVVLCWLRLSHTEALYTDRLMANKLSIEQADYYERRLSAAQRRYLRSIETLARVSKLLRSATVQVNIGQQQVNVAGDVKPGKKRARRKRAASSVKTGG